jgi:5-methylcytosine-specific restriction endonuclease McrA
MPINYKKYPPNWKELRAAVLERANNKCEFCGVENYSTGVREADGTFTQIEGMALEAAELDGEKVIQIVLTVAHLDHDEENHNVTLERLAALCQRCHLNYDIPEKKKKRRNKKAVGDLFE